MTDKQKGRYEIMAWAIILSILTTGIWATYRVVDKLTEPCPTVECPQHVPFATVEDMRQLVDELEQCRQGEP